jgi:DnaK suppressor protein
MRDKHVSDTQLNLPRLQGLLLARRALLLGQVSDEAMADLEQPQATVGPGEPKDAGDSSTDTVTEDVRLGDAQRKTDKVREIDAALSRISEGTYGICEECGEPIDVRRLLQVPEATRCTNCQDMIEQRDRSQHQHPTL